MKAEDLKLDELVEFNEGWLSLHGRRLILHDLNAFAQFRKDLIDMVGLDQARRILTRFGYFQGQADAAAMKRIFEWENITEWLKAGPRLHTLQGIARTTMKSLRIDEHTGNFTMEITWYESAEADEHVIGFGKTDHPVCWILTGYASGYSSYCLEKNIYFIEKKCRAQGDRICHAIGKEQSVWGDEIKPFLPYYQSFGIHSKVEHLTQELRKKSRELAQKKKQLDLLTQIAKPLFAEVHSESFRRVLETASRVAPFDSSVLITGETGTGKEVIARHIHSCSHRSNGLFIGINCGALPETLLESELFGHKAGAFTGAIHDRIGLFEQSEKGTIFLDEIGEITPAMQLKILRVLQEREIIRIGESKPRKVDIRIIAATNKNLVQAIREGKFREDLYYRLRVIEIEIPPLRQRKEDIIPLSRYFVTKLSRKLNIPHLHLDAKCIDYLQEYDWPGNVRELENAIERAAVFCKDGAIQPDCFPPSIIHSDIFQIKIPVSFDRTLTQIEDKYIRAVLDFTGGNKTKAAKILGLSQVTLWRKLKEIEKQS